MAFTFNTGANAQKLTNEEILKARSAYGYPAVTTFPDALPSTDELLETVDINGQLEGVQDNIDQSLPKGKNIDISDVDLAVTGHPDFPTGPGGLGALGAKQVSNNTQPLLTPAPNVLHDYASSTYRITWGAQSLAHHRLTQQPNGSDIGVPQLTEILMTSGGGREVDGVQRSDIFSEDFYLESLRITSIIGANEAHQGSNSVGIEFAVIEPYAVSLIERLLALANKMGYDNYIEIPYVLKIDFIGYKDDANFGPSGQGQIIPGTTKYIPFRLTYMDFAVKESGAKYECTGIPMNHMALNQTVAALPTQVEVNAGNVGNFFKKGASTGDSPGQGKGLVETINAYNKGLRDEGSRLTFDEIDIVLDPILAGSVLETLNVAKVGMLKVPAETAARFQGRHTPARQYGFNAGTSIQSVINGIITNSKFYTDQIADAKRADTLRNQPLDGPGTQKGLDPSRGKRPPFNGFKITTTYEMKEYDNKLNRHAYKATFYVDLYAVPGLQSDKVGRSEIESVAKEYNYLFTGQNYDIIDLDIKFNLAFYNNVTDNVSSAGSGTKTTQAQKTRTNDKNRKDNVVDPLVKKVNEVNNGNQQGPSITMTGTAEDPKKIQAEELHSSIMQESTGDMVTFDMTILGDPAWIKQDDILFRVVGDDPMGKTGSMKQDNGDMYVRLKFKVFDDIDPLTGLRNEARQFPYSNFNRRSTFDGLYKVMTLDNIFDGGVFTQNLVMMRSFVQEDEPAKSESVTTGLATVVGARPGGDFLTNGPLGTGFAQPTTDYLAPVTQGAKSAQEAAKNATAVATDAQRTAENAVTSAAGGLQQQATDGFGQISGVDAESITAITAPPPFNIQFGLGGR